ncbi:hypothetical protein Tco_0804628 [Tanacetum coccineum]|uniref:Uncharacterized protein n=1 Tax=Tanacetum coccineum TaxID=301880 RepID=A0ABQ5A959_9ASTR
MSALRRSNNENMLSTMNLIHMCLKDSILQAGNPVKEILLKLNLPDHSSQVDPHGFEVGGESDEVLKSNNFKEVFVTLIPNYEHVGPEVTRSQEGKDYKMAKRDYAWLRILRSLKDHIQVKNKIQAKA